MRISAHDLCGHFRRPTYDGMPMDGRYAGKTVDGRKRPAVEEVSRGTTQHLAGGLKLFIYFNIETLNTR